MLGMRLISRSLPPLPHGPSAGTHCRRGRFLPLIYQVLEKWDEGLMAAAPSRYHGRFISAGPVFLDSGAVKEMQLCVCVCV